MPVKRIRLILLIFWLILAGLIVWFKVLPGGKATYSVSYPAGFNFLGAKGFIGHLTPVDRVVVKEGENAEIIGDPVYFSVFTPRTFNEAKVTVTYQDNLTTSTPIVEAGVLVDNIVWRYQLAPLQNKLLETAFSNWTSTNSGNLLLLQKNKNFSSVEEFLNTLKTEPKKICNNQDIKFCLATYNIDVASTYSGLDYNKFNPINIPLKGAHQFYFLLDDKTDLKFDFYFADLNLDKKSDPIVVSVYKDNNKIYSTTVEDAFGGEGTGEVRDLFVPISYANSVYKEGLYKLEVKVGEDIVIKKISRAPSALNIIGKIHPVTVGNLPLSFWTDSSFVKLTTNNPVSRQTINFGGDRFSLSEPYQQFEFSSKESGLKKIILEKDDVILETDGVFSLAPEEFFNPDFKKVDEHFVLNSNTDYILAKYELPTELANNFKQASVVLNTKEAYRENGKYSFMISVPGLSLAKEGNLKISDIKIEFSGRTLLDKIKEKLGFYDNKN